MLQRQIELAFGLYEGPVKGPCTVGDALGIYLPRHLLAAKVPPSFLHGFRVAKEANPLTLGESRGRWWLLNGGQLGPQRERRLEDRLTCTLGC